jgi:hypothetical protein
LNGPGYEALNRIEDLWYELKSRSRKFKYPGAVDADGHILEDAKLWENYCEAKYKPLAIRIKEDEEGLEYLEIAGKPSRVSRRGTFSNVAAMGEVTREKGSHKALAG